MFIKITQPQLDFLVVLSVIGGMLLGILCMWNKR